MHNDENRKSAREFLGNLKSLSSDEPLVDERLADLGNAIEDLVNRDALLDPKQEAHILETLKLWVNFDWDDSQSAKTQLKRKLREIIIALFINSCSCGNGKTE